ncbi:MAG: hypothetical protein ACRD0Y_00920 [Terriglobales bacterium]
MKAIRVLLAATAAATVLALTAAAQTTAPIPKVSNIPAPGTAAAGAMTPPAAMAPMPTAAANTAAAGAPSDHAIDAVLPPPPETAADSDDGAAVAPATSAAAPTAAEATAAALSVPQGTPIALQLETRLNTQYNSDGDGFAARVMTPVYYRGHEVIPSGSILEGHVMHVQDARPAQSESELLLKPDLLTLPNGQRYTISAEVIQNDPHSKARVDTEGMLREPRGMLASDVHHTEIGGVGGFIGGAVLAGGEGAMMGAGVGAAVAVGIWLVRRRHLVLNPGSHLTVRLQRPIRLTATPAASREN